MTGIFGPIVAPSLQEAFAAMADSASLTSLAALIDEHYSLVYRYAYRLCGAVVDAEDLTQQTFLTAQAKLDQLRDPAAARGWLCTIVRHAYLRERRQPQRTLSLWEGAEPWSEPSPPEEIGEAALQAALAALRSKGLLSESVGIALPALTGAPFSFRRKGRTICRTRYPPATPISKIFTHSLGSLVKRATPLTFAVCKSSSPEARVLWDEPSPGSFFPTVGACVDSHVPAMPRPPARTLRRPQPERLQTLSERSASWIFQVPRPWHPRARARVP